MQQPQEQEQEHIQIPDDRCCFCVEGITQPCPGPGNPSFTPICGHRVHLACYIATGHYDEPPSSCPLCHTTFLSIDQEQWIRRFARDIRHTTILNRNEKKIQDLKTVWNNEPQFRNEVRALKAYQVRMGKAAKEFKKEKKELLTRYKEEIEPSVLLLKSIKSKYKKEAFGIKSQRSFRALSSLFQKKEKQILEKYNISHLDDLSDLRQLRGAPKLMSKHGMRVAWYAYRSMRWRFRIYI